MAQEDIDDLFHSGSKVILYLHSLKMYISFLLPTRTAYFGSSLANKFVFTHFIKMGITFPEDWHNYSALCFM